MTTIRLLSLDLSTISSLLSDTRRFSSELGIELTPVTELVRGMAEQTAAFLRKTPRASPWGAYLVIDATSNRVVGTCAFKEAPSAETGWAEIAYYTFAPYEEQGFATAMAAKLVEIARVSPAAKAVIAHTLPEANASVTVLKKLGFEHLGTVTDPDDGPVWRWKRELSTLN